ncbi:MAG: MBL fold metallo-hydrolase [Ruminococcus sp.]|jgi:phosphoribosyl 1,2-cyclic phosphodiesterase|nr:MBL fold metallo-hydrolase [Ruminococcus sp.]
MRLYPLFSSSKGNSYYLGSKTAGVLIDAGGSARRITSALASNGIPAAAVRAIFITHEHSDHMKALAVLLKRVNVPVFATPGTVKMLERNLSGAVLRSFSERIYIDDISGEVTIIKTSHDSAEPCGYRFDFEGASVSFLTDSGVITDDFGKAISSETIVLESNYDPFSLAHGDYPPYLKARITGRFGHLANEVSAKFARELIKGGAKNILLAHLSENNNTPELAREAFLAGTSEFTEGKDYFLKILSPVNDNWFCGL